MQDGKTFLGTQPIKKLLPKLAVPTVIAQLVNMLYNIVDRIYIGHIPEVGSLALTGIGVCMPLILIVSAFSAFVASGGAPRASIFMGRGDCDSAERTLGGCLTMQVIISLLLTAAMLIWKDELLYLFGASENTIYYAADYMGIYALGTIFVQITLGLNAFITAQGFAKVGMKTVIIGAALNIVLDPVFIFAFGMGVKGAALATVISQAVSCAWVISFLCGSKTVLRLKKENLLPGLRLMPPCIALGLSVFVMQASESVISMCFNTSLLRYGGDIAVGAMTILSSVMQFAMLPLQGVAQGAQPITSYNFGAGNSARVRESFRLLLTVCLVYSVALWGLVVLFPRIFVGMFASDAQLIDFASRALRAVISSSMQSRESASHAADFTSSSGIASRDSTESEDFSALSSSSEVLSEPYERLSRFSSARRTLITSRLTSETSPVFFTRTMHLPSSVVQRS